MKNFNKNDLHFICGNYMADTYDCYLKGWDRTFDPSENLGGMSIISQIESWIYEETDKDISFQANAQVRVSKKVAKKLSRKMGDASAIIVDTELKDMICKHFAPELDKGFGVLAFTELETA